MLYFHRLCNFQLQSYCFFLTYAREKAILCFFCLSVIARSREGVIKEGKATEKCFSPESATFPAKSVTAVSQKSSNFASSKHDVDGAVSNGNSYLTI